VELGSQDFSLGCFRWAVWKAVLADQAKQKIRRPRNGPPRNLDTKLRVEVLAEIRLPHPPLRTTPVCLTQDPVEACRQRCVARGRAEHKRRRIAFMPP